MMMMSASQQQQQHQQQQSDSQQQLPHQHQLHAGSSHNMQHLSHHYHHLHHHHQPPPQQHFHPQPPHQQTPTPSKPNINGSGSGCHVKNGTKQATAPRVVQISGESGITAGRSTKYRQQPADSGTSVSKRKNPRISSGRDHNTQASKQLQQPSLIYLQGVGAGGLQGHSNDLAALSSDPNCMGESVHQESSCDLQLLDYAKGGHSQPQLYDQMQTGTSVAISQSYDTYGHQGVYMNHMEDFQQLSSQNSYVNLLKQESFASVMSRLNDQPEDERQRSCQSSPDVSASHNRRRQLPPTAAQDQHQHISAFNFFERQQSDRKKRTFEILSQFNPALATEVVYKMEHNQQKLAAGVSEFDLGSRRHYRSENSMITRPESSKDWAATRIQAFWKGHCQRQKYERLLIEQFTAQEEARENEEKKRVERWMIRKETEQLEKQIEDRNRLFRANLNRRIQAAIVIQRAFRSHLRLKQKGISTTQLLERKQIEEQFGDTQMPTALMENLLEEGDLKRRNNCIKKNSQKDSKKASKQWKRPGWSDDCDDECHDESQSDSQQRVVSSDGRGTEMDDDEDVDQVMDSCVVDDDDDDDDAAKIPKKTKIFEGKVVQVEKLVKEEEELRSQHASVQKKNKANSRTRILQAEIRRDKQRINLEQQQQQQQQQQNNQFQIITGIANQQKQHKSLAASRQNSSRSNYHTPAGVVTKSTSEASSAIKADKRHGKNSSRQSQIVLPSQPKCQLNMQGLSARSSKQSRGNTPVFKNNYIDFSQIDLEPSSEPYYAEEIQNEHQDLSNDEISRKFVLIAKKQGISLLPSKSKKPTNNRNGAKIWSRRNSYQCEDHKTAISAVEQAGGAGSNSRRAQQRSKGLSLLGIDATDFPPPIMQQSKTPNNIKSVIRQVNFVRAPRDLMKAAGNKIVQKVIMQKAAVANKNNQNQQLSPQQQQPQPPQSSARLKKRSIDFSSQYEQAQQQFQQRKEFRTVAQSDDEDDEVQEAEYPLMVNEDRDLFNKVKKLSKRDIGSYEPYARMAIQPSSIDQLFARRQKVHMIERPESGDNCELTDLLAADDDDVDVNDDDVEEVVGEMSKPAFLVPSVQELPIGRQPNSGGELSNGSGSGEQPFQGYAVQRMPQGLAKELVSSSTGSGNSGGLGALVGSNGINTGSLGSKGSGGPLIQISNEAGTTSQLDMSLNNLFDSFKMKNGPLIHANRFDLTQKLNEENFLKSILNGGGCTNSMSSGGLQTDDNGENVPPQHQEAGVCSTVEFADLVHQSNINQMKAEVQEPRIIDSNSLVVEDMFNLQQEARDRFDLYDAAAAVNAAQKLRQKLTDEQSLLMKDSGGSSSAEDSGLRRSLPGEQSTSMYKQSQEFLSEQPGPIETQTEKLKAQFDQMQKQNAEKLAAYELDHRYQYFRELLKNFSEREESLKDKLLNRDHLLSSLYNQDAMMLESGVSLTTKKNNQLPLQQPSSVGTKHHQSAQGTTNKAIPVRKDVALAGSKHPKGQIQKNQQLGFQKLAHPASSSAQPSQIKIGAVSRSSNAFQAACTAQTHVGNDGVNPYQNQNISTPYKIKSGKKQSAADTGAVIQGQLVYPAQNQSLATQQRDKQQQHLPSSASPIVGNATTPSKLGMMNKPSTVSKSSVSRSSLQEPLECAIYAAAPPYGYASASSQSAQAPAAIQAPYKSASSSKLQQQAFARAQRVGTRKPQQQHASSHQVPQSEYQ